MADGINLTALKAPTTLLPRTTTAGAVQVYTAMNSILFKHILSGGLTADTYLELVSLSSSGVLWFAGAYRKDGTARTVGLKISIDGTTVFDQTDASDTTTNGGHIGVGIADNVASAGAVPQQIRFNASLSLQIKSSITETDKLALVYLTEV